MKFINTYEDFNPKRIIRNRNKLVANRFKKAMVGMNLDECVEHIKENCKQWINDPQKIQRGILDKKYDYFYSEPVNRLSVDNLNYYTLIIDNTPEWKYYPKRKKSFICKFESSSFSSWQYYVIPEDNSSWGVVNSQDIWNGFGTGLYEHNIYFDIATFFRYFSEISEMCGVKINDTNWSQFKKDLLKLETVIKDININDAKAKEDFQIYLNETHKIIIEMIKKGNILDQLRSIMNPDKNKFKSIQYESIRIYSGNLKYPQQDGFVKRKLECWTDSPCIFVHEFMIKHVLKEISKTNKNFKEKIKYWK